jgi:protein-export membrane protein SecD
MSKMLNKLKNFLSGIGREMITNKRAKIWWGVILILVVVILAGILNYPNYYDKGVDWIRIKTGIALPHAYNLPFKLGLDLQGGTHLVYEADTSSIPSGERGDALEGARDVIERRVNAFGVAEPVVQTTEAGDSQRIIVELAGIQDVTEAIKMIGETPLLEFKETNTDPPRELTAEEQKGMDEYNKKAKQKADEAIKKLKDPKADFAALVKEYSDDASTKSVGGDLGFITKDGIYSSLWSEAAKLGVGKTSSLIDRDAEINILKLSEEREASKEVKANHILICFKGAERCEKETSKEDARKQIDELKIKATKDNFVELAKANSTEPGAAQSGGDLGWFGKGMMVAAFEEKSFAMKVGEISDVVETQFGFHLIYKVDERSIKEYRVSRILFDKQTKAEILPKQDAWKYTGLTGKQLKKAQVEFDPNSNAPQVGLEFNDEGKQLFADITKRNLGKQIAIFLDGGSIVDTDGDGVISPNEVYAPKVQDEIKDGKAVITGSMNINEAKLMVQRLNAGALPVPINLISQETVGASLGSESVSKSLVAGLIGFLAVVVFMILYYRLPGLLASLALVFYAVIVLILFKLFNITLTLAGIAGFILSVGMAVDANVLIFERMKEELKLGKPVGSSIDEGVKRAWPSIRDGNITTLISCFILFWFSTSTIKGFALTLSVGIIISMVSALLVTKIFLNFVAPWIKNIWWFGVKRKNM